MSGALGQKEVGNRIAAIKEKMVCPRGFECLSNSFENLFRANNFTGGDCPECKGMGDCQFKSDLGFLYLCKCPLMMYVFSLIKMDKEVGMAALPSKRKYAITTQGSNRIDSVEN